jgi:hypothetical protein
VPDARDIVDELTSGGVRLNIGGSVHDPTDPIGRLLFTTLSMIAEFEADLARARTREGMAVAHTKGRVRGMQPKLSPKREPTWSSSIAAASTPSANSRNCSPSPLSTIYRAVARAGARTSPAADEGRAETSAVPTSDPALTRIAAFAAVPLFYNSGHGLKTCHPPGHQLQESRARAAPAT